MKLLIALLLLIFFGSFHPQEAREICVIVMNDPTTRPIATYEDFFWDKNVFHDSVIIRSNKLMKFIEKRVSQLQQDSILGITVSSALIIRTEKTADTFYSDMFFRNWKIKGLYYTDTIGDLKQMLGNFFLSKYSSEWK